MIYIIEPQCKKWQHEEVGAGFLYYMESVCENEQLFLFAMALDKK